MPHPSEIRLEKLATGKCSAVSRPAALGVGIRWWPTVADEDLAGTYLPEDGYPTKPEAVAAAKRARAVAFDLLAQSQGEAP